MKITGYRFLQLLLVTIVFAGDLTSAGTDPAQIRFSHHNAELGLSSNEVADIVQDQRGGIWLATRNGLNYYDAHETGVYRREEDSENSLSGNDLSCLALGPKEAIWVGTADAGLNRFDPVSGDVERIHPGEFVEGGIDARGLPSPVITDLAVSEQQFLWIGTDKGLAVLNLVSGAVSRTKGLVGWARISSISVFDENSVWVGTTMGEVYRKGPLDSGFTKVFATSAPVTAIARDIHLQIWIGTQGAGLLRLKPDGEAESCDVGARDVNTVISDKQGELWIGSTHGLIRMSPSTRATSTYVSVKGEPYSLCHNHVTSVFEDRKRNMLWIGSRGGGTSRFNLDQYTFPHFRNGRNGSTLPHDSIWSIASSREGHGIWLGTELGVVLWDCDGNRVIDTLTELREGGTPYAVSLLEDSRRNLWVGTKGEGLILRTADGSIVRFSREEDRKGSLGHNFVSEIFEDSQGRIWIGTFGGGLYRCFDRGNRFELQKTEGKDRMNFVNRVREDSYGRIWAGCEDGLFVLKRDRIFWEKYSESIFPDAKKSHRITALFPSDRFLWIGTHLSGVTRLDLRTGEISHLHEGNSDLPDNHILSLVEDRKGFLWICHGSGISRLNGGSNSLRNFSEEDGLQPELFSPNALAVSNRDYLYFGGKAGFNRIDPDVLPAAVVPPCPILTSFEYFGEPVVPVEGGILEKPLRFTSLIQIPYDSRIQLAFRFANLDYRFPNRGYFRYRLEGYEEGWKAAGSDRRASYQYLPVGSYRFVVQSSPDGKKWSGTPARIDLRITPPWWQTWWFSALAGTASLLVLCFVVRTFFRKRIESIQRREAEVRAERDHAEAALARQLQNAVLLERTSRGLNEHGREDEVFTEPLKNLADHLRVDHALIFRVTTDPSSGEDNGLKLIANYSSPNQSALPPLPFAIHDEIIQQTIRSTTAFAIPVPELIEDFLGNLDEVPVIHSVLFVVTSYFNKPNGIIALFSDRLPREWERDDITLVNTLSLQFGISIAQMSLAEKEQLYLQQLEESAHQAEVANRAKSDFLAKMTHELRTPLNSIIGFTAMVRAEEGLCPRQRDLMDIIQNNGEHLLDVVNEILDLSKIEAGKIEKSCESFELLPLLKSVHEMLAMKAQAKKIGFEFEVKGALPGTILTDRSKLRQILINLLGNAIKFTDRGVVKLTVFARALTDPYQEEGVMKRRVALSFEVSDTGRGIAEDEIDGLFVKYTQTETGKRSSEGTGLGLPIAKSFIELLGGRIEVKSKPGEGTSFRFFVECEEVAGARDEVSQSQVAESRAHKINGYVGRDGEPVRILVAEDQPNNMLLIRTILNRAGFEIREAGNGKEAVEICDSWRPHLIFMDEDMPIMKGSEATQIIRSRKYEMEPVIISLTAFALEQAREMVLKAGSHDFLGKPFKAHEIYSMISRHLELDYTFSDAA